MESAIVTVRSLCVRMDFARHRLRGLSRLIDNVRATRHLINILTRGLDMAGRNLRCGEAQTVEGRSARMLCLLLLQ